MSGLFLSGPWFAGRDQKVQAFAFEDRIKLVPLQPIQKLRGFLTGIETTVDRETDPRVNIVDSAWFEYFADEPNFDFFAPAIEATAFAHLSRTR